MVDIEEIKVGMKVRVLNKEGREVHKGTVLALTNSFAKVYRPRKNLNDSQSDMTQGDACPDTAEWYPLQSREFRITVNNAKS